MKKILFILLLFVNLQCVIHQDGDIEIRSFTTAEAQHMNTEAFLPEQDIPGVNFVYECSDCGRKFSSYPDLEWHLQNKTFLCTDCGERFCTQLILLQHQHNTCPIFACVYECGKRFHTEDELKKHKEECPFALYDDENRKECNYCHAQFSTPEARKTHEASCSYKDSSTESDSPHTNTVPRDCECVFERLPKDIWLPRDLVTALASLAYAEYCQPRYGHTSAEIEAFKSKCFFVFKDARFDGFQYVWVNSRSYYVDLCSARKYLKYYAGGSRATIFMDRGGHVSFCTIGEYKDGSFLCLEGGSCSGNQDVSYLYYFTIEPSHLMSLVESSIF